MPQTPWFAIEFDLGWYVKHTCLPQSWEGERVYIRVGSACYCGTVYINGVEAGSHKGGHLPFEFEITDLVQFDRENVFAMQLLPDPFARSLQLRPAYRVPAEAVSRASCPKTGPMTLS